MNSILLVWTTYSISVFFSNSYWEGFFSSFYSSTFGVSGFSSLCFLGIILACELSNPRAWLGSSFLAPVAVDFPLVTVVWLDLSVFVVFVSEAVLNCETLALFFKCLSLAFPSEPVLSLLAPALGTAGFFSIFGFSSSSYFYLVSSFFMTVPFLSYTLLVVSLLSPNLLLTSGFVVSSYFNWIILLFFARFLEFLSS